MEKSSAEFEPIALITEERKRAFCFGEALRAISMYVGEDIVSPPNNQLLILFEAAYRRMKVSREDFSPQDFALYAMSSLLLQVKKEEEILRLRFGAARYLLKVKAQLTSDFRELASEAQTLLKTAPADSSCLGALPGSKPHVFSSVRRKPKGADNHQIKPAQVRKEMAVKQDTREDSGAYRRSATRHQRSQNRALNQSAAVTSSNSAEASSDFIHERRTPIEKEKSSGSIIVAYVLFLSFVIGLMAILFSG